MTDDAMPPSNPATDTSPAQGSFDDAGELGAYLDDTRSFDKKATSTTQAATIVVDSFAAKSGAGAWTSLDRATVASRLRELIASPRTLDQGGLNLCGPAAFYQMALGRDPAAVATLATELFDHGSATIGTLAVAPNPDLLQADYAQLNAGGRASSQCEWMMLGALRNATDAFWQGSWRGDPDQELSAMTRPEELADWMSKSAIWSTTQDGGKWASNPGIPNAADLAVAEGCDAALLIHLNLIAKSKVEHIEPGPDARTSHDVLMTQFPNHWVILLNQVTPDTAQEHVTLTLWTWGGVIKLTVENQDFIDNYFGAVTARM